MQLDKPENIKIQSKHFNKDYQKNHDIIKQQIKKIDDKMK